MDVSGHRTQNSACVRIFTYGFTSEVEVTIFAYAWHLVVHDVSFGRNPAVVVVFRAFPYKTQTSLVAVVILHEVLCDSAIVRFQRDPSKLLHFHTNLILTAIVIKPKVSSVEGKENWRIR